VLTQVQLGAATTAVPTHAMCDECLQNTSPRRHLLSYQQSTDWTVLAAATETSHTQGLPSEFTLTRVPVSYYSEEDELFVRVKPCPHCRRKVRLSQKTARQRRQSHFSATVSLLCDRLTILRQCVHRALSSCEWSVQSLAQALAVQSTLKSW